MLAFLVLTAVTFSLFGFIIGIWADGFEKLQLIPLLIVTPLTFLGGSFYSIDMLPPFWQTVTLFNPVVYLISGFRWSFYGIADVGVGVSLAMTLAVPGALPRRRVRGSSRPATGSRASLGNWARRRRPGARRRPAAMPSGARRRPGNRPRVRPETSFGDRRRHGVDRGAGGPEAHGRGDGEEVDVADPGGAARDLLDKAIVRREVGVARQAIVAFGCRAACSGRPRWRCCRRTARSSGRPAKSMSMPVPQITKSAANVPRGVSISTRLPADAGR